MKHMSFFSYATLCAFSLEVSFGIKISRIRILGLSL
ncbi:hypothetical protein CpecG_0659 [Chlamydia pecorum MC/MarsBar]|nr:hypothetical protein CpecF_0660 [Chlamydia pecorum DBDeUG]ETF38242.1 hypothetical protein CpecG_0659 [Chlamydia pecorum MC/MarsBar]